MSDCIGFKRAETHSEKHRSVQLQLLHPTYSPLQSTALHSRRKNQAPPPHTAASRLHILPLTHSLTHSSIHPSIQMKKTAAQTMSDPIRTRARVNSPNLAIRITTRTRRRTMIMMSLPFLCILEKREKPPPPRAGLESFFFFLFSSFFGVITVFRYGYAFLLFFRFLIFSFKLEREREGWG